MAMFVVKDGVETELEYFDGSRFDAAAVMRLLQTLIEDADLYKSEGTTSAAAYTAGVLGALHMSNSFPIKEMDELWDRLKKAYNITPEDVDKMPL